MNTKNILQFIDERIERKKKRGISTIISRKDAAENGAASTPGSVVDEREDALGRNAQFRRSVVSDVGASGRPDGGVSHTLDQLERNHSPRFADVRNVEEAQDAAQQTKTQHLRNRNAQSIQRFLKFLDG